MFQIHVVQVEDLFFYWGLRWSPCSDCSPVCTASFRKGVGIRRLDDTPEDSPFTGEMMKVCRCSLILSHSYTAASTSLEVYSVSTYYIQLLTYRTSGGHTYCHPLPPILIAIIISGGHPTNTPQTPYEHYHHCLLRLLVLTESI